nr:hypothetical protein GCM10020092_035280 [Actinoplanes digitatis]
MASPCASALGTECRRDVAFRDDAQGDITATYGVCSSPCGTTTGPTPRCGRSACRCGSARTSWPSGCVRPAPPSTTKRTVQRYESGEIANPRPASARALEVVTRLPLASLGFPAGADTMVVEDGRGGHDLEVRVDGLLAAPA